MLCEGYLDDKTTLQAGVLILVLMEDALRVRDGNYNMAGLVLVLILVLMEDALRGQRTGEEEVKRPLS